MSNENEETVLTRDCPATIIPAGDEVVLPAGTAVLVTQALGGAVTLRTDSGLYRIEPRDTDALGDELAARLREAETASRPDTDTPFSEDAVWEALKGCYDPEIPVNIVDLGLIYNLDIEEAGSDRYDVAVKMTLTARGCGMGPRIAGDAQHRIESLPAVASARVEIVWDPQWTPHMISAEGRQALGM